MKIGSNCSGECCVCHCGGACIAGHGDDFFIFATKNKIISNLNAGYYPAYTDYMKQVLKEKFNYDYDKEGGKIEEEIQKPQETCCKII